MPRPTPTREPRAWAGDNPCQGGPRALDMQRASRNEGAAVLFFFFMKTRKLSSSLIRQHCTPLHTQEAVRSIRKEARVMSETSRNDSLTRLTFLNNAWSRVRPCTMGTLFFVRLCDELQLPIFMRSSSTTFTQRRQTSAFKKFTQLRTFLRDL